MPRIASKIDGMELTSRPPEMVSSKVALLLNFQITRPIHSENLGPARTGTRHVTIENPEAICHTRIKFVHRVEALLMATYFAA